MNLYETYYIWLCSKIGPAAPDPNYEKVYGDLLRWLYSRPFRFDLAMDANRSSDGIRLRYQYAAECHIPQPIAASALDCRDCTMLEMMVALDARCIDGEYSYTDEHYGEIFWVMIRNLGLLSPNFDFYKAEEAVQKVENHAYAFDGSNGGLFVLRNPRADLRGVDIWYQAMWFITENSDLEV